MRGAQELLSFERLVALVGTRKPTPWGTRAAAALGAALARSGWVMLSGLSPGIDTTAHVSALKHDVPTVAVLGSGLDAIADRASRGLAARILERGGALLSEWPGGEPARRHHRITRDRLQSGLSAAVIVAQSELAGGTMHTARFAAAQGRALFCVTPTITDRASEGSRVLLERPARELCSLVPAWRGARALCARLGDQPLARPVNVDEPAELLRALEQLLV